MIDVVVVGDINVDVLASVDEYPSPGGHGLAEELSIESGGSAANTAIMLGLLGLDVAMIGRVGVDPLADVALRGLRSATVDVSRVRRDAEAATGLFFVAVTPDGERTMFGGRGANGRLSPDDIDAAAIEKARWLHLSGYPLLFESGRAALHRAADIARGAGVPISLDVGVGRVTPQWRESALGLVTDIDVLLPSDVEVESLAGESDPARAGEQLRAAGVGTVIVKRGTRGCFVSAGAEQWAMPAFDVEPVDSTGAGDAFDAGIIAGQLAELDLRASCLLANVLGGLATMVVGAGSAFPGPARVLEFLEGHRDNPRWAEWAGEFDRIRDWVKGSVGEK